MALILEEVMGFVKRNSREARRWNGGARSPLEQPLLDCRSLPFNDPGSKEIT